MYAEVGSMFCCGVDEIHGLEDAECPKDFVDAVVANAEGLPAFMFYTARAKFSKLGNQVAKYIERNKLGKVTRMSVRPILNANSGNKIHMWVWQLNKPEFEKRQIARAKEEEAKWQASHTERTDSERRWWQY